MSPPGDSITRTPIVSKVIYNLKQMPNNICDRVMATQRSQDPSIWNENVTLFGKMLKILRLPWIIWVGPKGHRKYF